MASKCPICKQTTRQVYTDIPGYQVSAQTYSIMYCEGCDTSYALPMQSDDNIYQHIYEKGIQVPGYNRYHTYVADINKSGTPLDYLAQSEDVYWGVRRFLQTCFPQPQQITVLEIGCGLGYLTYALNKSGYTTIGTDLSEKAILDATVRYGDYYRCADIQALTSFFEKYDAVILTEVIEHVTDPVAFIADLSNLLKPGGKIFLSTPDRQAAGNPDEYWDTDLPPVHLWWFSKSAFKKIADALQLTMSIIDSTPFFVAHHPIVFSAVEDRTVSRQSTFDEDGNLLFSSRKKVIRSRLKSWLILWGVMPAVRYLFFRFFPGRKRRHNRYAKLLVVLGK